MMKTGIRMSVPFRGKYDTMPVREGADLNIQSIIPIKRCVDFMQGVI